MFVNFSVNPPELSEALSMFASYFSEVSFQPHWVYCQLHLNQVQQHLCQRKHVEQHLQIRKLGKQIVLLDMQLVCFTCSASLLHFFLHFQLRQIQLELFHPSDASAALRARTAALVAFSARFIAASCLILALFLFCKKD